MAIQLTTPTPTPNTPTNTPTPSHRGPTLTRLTDHDRIELIDLFAKGYTVRHIREYLTAKIGGSPTDQQLMQLATLYADDIDTYRRQLSKDTLSRGLAVKAVRVQRLAELAEGWEESARSNNKSANVYLSALRQIQAETEALGTLGVLPEDDKWGQLLLSLRDKVKEVNERQLTATAGTTAGSALPEPQE